MFSRGDKVQVPDIPHREMPDTTEFAPDVWEREVRGKVFEVAEIYRYYNFEGGGVREVALYRAQGSVYTWHFTGSNIPLLTLARPAATPWLFEAEEGEVPLGE